MTERERQIAEKLQYIIAIREFTGELQKVVDDAKVTIAAFRSEIEQLKRELYELDWKGTSC